MEANFDLTKENLPLIEQMAEQMPGGFFIYQENEQRNLLYVNRVVLDIFGCETLEQFKALTGFTFPGMVHPEDFAMVQMGIDEQIAPENGENLDYIEYRIIRRDGIVRWVDDYGHFTHSKDFGDIFYVFIGDITEKNLSLQERERRANESKNNFLYNISHDIRTPLNAVMGYTRLALLHFDEKAKVKGYLEKVNQSGNELLLLVDNLIEMSQLDFGHLELNAGDCDLKSELQRLHAEFDIAVKTKKQHLLFVIDVPSITLHLDMMRLRKILANLLENAVLYSPEGGDIKFSAKSTSILSPTSMEYEFKITDSGEGIPAEDIQKLYDPFEKMPATDEGDRRGIGIGLALTKQLIDIMGGTISVESVPGGGSTFTVLLPIQVTDENELKDLKEPILTKHQRVARLLQSDNIEIPKISEPHHILLAEDIETNRDLAERVLQEAGYTVDSVFNGADALEQVETHPVRYYDLILMDVQMPVMNGHDAAAAIRHLGRRDTEIIPIIALSANKREEHQRKSLESGMNAHLSKPFDPSELVALMESFIAEAKEKY